MKGSLVAGRCGWPACLAVGALMLALGAGMTGAQPADTPPSKAEASQPAPSKPAADEAKSPADSAPPAEGAPTDTKTPVAKPASPTGAADSTDAAKETPAPSPKEPQATEPASPAVPAPPSAPKKTETPAAAPESAPQSPSAVPGLSKWLIGAMVIALLVVPFWIGNVLANRWRMPDHGWKIGLVLCSVVSASAITYFGWPPHLGPDLSGGINLIYEVSPDEANKDIDTEKLIAALTRRVNPSGVKEVTIRPYGEKQVEIIIPRADPAERELIKEKISTAGALEFLITANRQDHKEAIEAAEESPAEEVKKDGETVARWAKIDLLQFDLLADAANRAQAELIKEAQQTKDRDVMLGDRVAAHWFTLGKDVYEQLNPAQRATLVEHTTPDGKREALVLSSGFELRENARGDIEVLVMMDPYKVTGADLDSATAGIDQSGRPAVHFNFKSAGARRFALLTSENAPDTSTGFYRQLGIVLDNTLLSAPRLNEPITGGRGEITGKFTEAEVNFLVSILNAGSLPAALNKVPISEQTTSATIGADTIRMATYAMVGSMIAVLLFMLVYYRFAGIVACLALLANLVLLMAVMILIKAAFTLPGMAGLVLTVGMAVDANVLIFERIREETSRGAALRMAIRNGFDRATATIVDANLTTLITAGVLYWIGTDQIKGFAVTLGLGIVMSMYTAVFCSRVVFEIAERRRWITNLNMMQFISSTNVDFLGKRWVAGIASIVLIAVGMVAVYFRGADMLDIDFTGGTSVTVALNEPATVGEVREAVKELKDVTVYGVGAIEEEEEGKQREFKIDTSIRDVALVEQQLRSIFGANLRTNHMDYDKLQLVSPSAGQTRSGAGKAEGGIAPGAARRDLPDDTVLALADSTNLALLQQPEPGAPPEPDEEKPADAPPAKPESKTEPQKETDIKGKAKPKGKTEPESKTKRPAGQIVVTKLTFDEPIKHDTLQQQFEAAFAKTGVPLVPVTLTNPDYEEGTSRGLTEWRIQMPLPPDKAELVLDYLQRDISGMVVFPSSNNIGGRVAGDTRQLAGYALFASLLMIIAYIWVRFERVSFGLAAVAALVHDVLVTVGLVALSSYLISFLPFLETGLLLEKFKISLPIVAALLTIIGYSLNDTIVIFDRIREVRGKSPNITVPMVNTSINQTLSRTLLTSLTTLIVVLILYIFGGPGIHGFAFALVVGVVAGTYSTIFIASPVLIWLTGSTAARR